MARPALWTAIRDRLGKEIAEGHYAPGERLPTEAELSARFSVNRHTVRRAIADLASSGVLRSRRGAGVFVASAPLLYPIGDRVRFRKNLDAAGRMPGRRMDFLGTRRPDSEEQAELRLPPDAEVYVCEGVSFADNVPIALFRSIFPATLPDLLDHLSEESSVTEALRRSGVTDYVRTRTEIHARRADAAQAVKLGIGEGDPLLGTVSLNATPEGIPVEFGKTWFAGDAVTLSVGGAG
ncbi:phosphonate metabolism transcriptional regulator PhnF [Aestuariibius sp. 2305UL40-4]|uniref:phosphonate metabolism transcriptional regulator PhnF n=1 Tax=Aestuariibius violaceus TaxID=3234132 RepID=UPI00345E3CD0